MDRDEIKRLWSRTVGDDFNQNIQRTFAHADDGFGRAPHNLEGGFTDAVELGRGGMGVVYRAVQAGLGRKVALKKSLSDEERARSQFVSEARVTGLLDHPNIVPVHDLVRQDDGQLCLVMKLVSGRSWMELLHPENAEQKADAKIYDQRRHLRVLMAVCQALAFAHHRGIVHCDLKPENIMIGPFGEVLVMDWGCAIDLGAARDHRPPLTREPKDVTGPFGTPCFLPPELAIGDGAAISPRTDVFLLGAILHDILEKRPPYDGNNLEEVLVAAAACQPPVLSDDVPVVLADIVMKAMARDPAQRYPNAQAFQHALEEYLETRESLRISSAAKTVLADCQARREGAGDHHEEYVELATALSGFTNALVLWSDNDQARDGATQARRLLTETALQNGDLGLADAYVRRIPAEDASRAELGRKLDEAIAQRDRGRRLGRLTRLALTATAAGIVVVSVSASVAIDNQRRVAENVAALAETRFSEIRRLSDSQVLQELALQDGTLWPAVPAQVPGMQAWLARARDLIARHPMHQAKLELIRAAAPKGAGGVPRFDTHEARWEHETLSKVVGGLVQLKDRDVPSMERRLRFAQELEEKTITAQKEAWTAAAARIEKAAPYHGLKIKPQLGLVPLGPDPESGLEEFAHLASGAVARRAGNASVRLAMGDGVVLVLIPGGTARIGATRGPAGPHSDPSAKAIERPVHTVLLDPFFFSKFEMTQDQWAHSNDSNPSAYPPGKEAGGNTMTGLHPVEQMRKTEALRAVERMGLTLATEVQWEYASRAGTSTIYWTGDTEESLQGACNLSDTYARTHDAPESWLFNDKLNDGHVVHAPVGSYRANAFGIHDTVGNVWEWCLDLYGSYELPTDAGTGRRQTPADAPPIFRGGGFRASVAHARSAERYSLYGNDFRAFDVGLRPARPLER